MTTKNDLQTLLATLNNSRDVWDELGMVDYELGTIQMFLEEIIHYGSVLNEYGGTDRSREKDARKIEALIKLLQSARTKLQSQTSIMHHLVLSKSAGFVEELIQSEDRKLAESNGTKSPTLIQ